MGGADSEVSATTTARPARGGDVRSARGPAHRRSGWGCTARRRTASSAASTPRASRTPAGARRPCWRALGGGAVAGEGIDRYPQQARAAARVAVVRGADAAGGVRDPARRRRPRSWRAIGIASAPDGAERAGGDGPDLPPRHLDRGRISIEEVMRLVGYDRAPARLPRASGAPAPSPRGARRSRARRAARRSGSPRSSAGASCRAAGWRRWAAPLRRGRRRQEPDLGRLRGDAHVAAARRCSTRPAATSRAASPTSACSRSARSSGARADAKEAPAGADATRRRSWSAGAPTG